jgi:hypothetical protein
MCGDRAVPRRRSPRHPQPQPTVLP